MTMISAVCFDMDGLMFNTEELYVLVGRELLRRRDKVLTDELLDRMTGRPSRISLQFMIDEHNLDDTIEQLEQETDEIFAPILDQHLAMMPGLEALLTSIESAEIPKALATSSRLPYTQKVLGQFGFEPRFEFLLTSENVTEGKPHPEIYLTAASRLNVAPNQMMVLEDSQAGCAAAVRAGAFAVAVPGPHSGRHQYPGARFIADTLADRRILAALDGAAN